MELTKEQFEDMKHLCQIMGLDISDDEIIRSYNEFAKDFSNFQINQLINEVCLN